MRSLALITVAVLVYLSLFPFNFTWAGSEPGIAWTPMALDSDWVDVIANFVAYVPLGFFVAAALGLPRWRAAGMATVFGAALSLFVEFAQQYLPMRNASLRDLAYNTAGTFAGAWIATISGRLAVRMPALPGRRNLFLFFCWLSWHTFPFIPNIRRHKFVELREQWTQWSWNPVEFFDLLLGAAALVAFLIQERPFGGSRWKWLLAAAVVAPVGLQFLVWHLTFSLSKLVAVTAGLAIAVAAWKPSSRPHKLALAAVLFAWVMARQLQPFAFSGMAEQFGWLPLQSLYTLNLDFVARLLAGKFFLYTALMASLSTAGFGLLRSTVVVTLAMAITEFLQIYIPGRTPEITDVCMIPMAALLIRSANGNGGALLRRTPDQ